MPRDEQAAGYISRAIEPVLNRAARQFPAVVLTGPRQSGKTTLLRRTFDRTHGYVSLEPPDVRAAAVSDPRGFLAMHPPPVILDEVHCAPDILIYIKEDIDAHRKDAGRYLLTGSQNLALAAQISESLAGRAAMLRLLPLSGREIAGRAEDPLPWEAPAHGGRRPPAHPSDFWATCLRGGFPELAADPARDAQLWHGSYIQTYLERDLRTLRQVGDLTQFQGFLRTLAGRNAQLLKLTDLAMDLGLAVNTIKAWLSVLEATYQVTILRPYAANLGKRLVKTPKVYFTDTGMACHLAGVRTATQAADGPLAGPTVEAAVLSEILKAYANRGIEPPVHFWRTSTGIEVDFVVETEGKLVPIEVKRTATPRPEMAAGIRAFRQAFGDRAAPGYVVHLGDVRLPLGPDAIALPFSDL